MENTLLSDKIIKNKIITLEDYEKLTNKNEFLLYGDNILEGISIMNTLIKNDEILSFYAITYNPIDEPVYIFVDKDKRFYCIKICGAYDKWELPQTALRIKEYIDLPDYIFYSLNSGKTILAGENTETASVGNSQWQREGRKVAAAKNKVPFIYQTFYSGKDESQDTIREPNSLQVYNHLVYSIRYRVQSFVAYYLNNFSDSNTPHVRTPEDSKEIFILYIKALIASDVDSRYLVLKKKYEKALYMHMISYLKEGKYSQGIIGNEPRLNKDLLIINSKVKDALLNNTEQFVDDLLNYIYGDNSNFIEKYPIDDFNYSKATDWTNYAKKQWIRDIFDFINKRKESAKTYITGQAKVGLVPKQTCEDFLISKFPKDEIFIRKKLENYDKVVLMPLRIHKKSNGVLTFSPDPESGEIVAFSELFGYNYLGNKRYPILGYGIVETPENFNFNSKKNTKLYKAIANYVDLLILNDKELIYEYDVDYLNDKSEYAPKELSDVKRKSLTEEVAVVSTFLNLTTINAKWKLCFIHTHHSSWQQLVVFKDDIEIQHKIDRVSTKVDLILQDKNKLFMLAEGKDGYYEFLSDGKIKKAMKDAGDLIDKLLKISTIKFDAFIYNLPTVPDKDPDYYVDCEVDKIIGAMKMGHFTKIAYHSNYVFVIVYRNKKNSTSFKLVYSNNFNSNLKKQLDKDFQQ